MLKTQEAATAQAAKALEEFQAAKATATAAHNELASLSYKMKESISSLEGVLHVSGHSVR